VMYMFWYRWWMVEVVALLSSANARPPCLFG